MAISRSFAELVADAGAGPEISDYLTARGLSLPANLALVAATEDEFDRHVHGPLKNGFTKAGVTHRVSTEDEPVARAVLMHLWMEARRDWHARMAAVPASSTAFPPVPGLTPAPAATPAAEDKAPKSFPQWAAQIDKYNARLFEGRRRHFPDRLLVGAESVLARMWWEATKSKLFTPVSLGEIVSKRTFQASGELNHMAVARAAQSSQTLRIVGTELVAAEDRPWDPRSLIALLDGAEAARWAMILVEWAPEEAINQYVDWFVGRARSKAGKVEQLRDFWQASGWRIAMAMRTGVSFADAAGEVMCDLTAFYDHMSTPDRATPAPKKQAWQANAQDTPEAYSDESQWTGGWAQGKAKKKGRGKGGGKKGAGKTKDKDRRNDGGKGTGKDRSRERGHEYQGQAWDQWQAQAWSEQGSGWAWEPERRQDTKGKR